MNCNDLPLHGVALSLYLLSCIPDQGLLPVIFQKKGPPEAGHITKTILI